MDKRDFNFSVMAVYAAILGGLAACQGTPVPAEKDLAGPPPRYLTEGLESSGEDLNFAEVRPRTAVRDELTMTFSMAAMELDVRQSYLSSEAQLFTALYEGLFSYNPATMEPIRAVAARWELSDDKKQWTFTLRKEAKYWNGDPVIAEHFRSAWLSLLHPSRDAPYSSLFDIIEGARDYRLGRLRDPNRVGIVAKDDQTLIVRLTGPASFLPSMLCHHAFSPIHPSMLNKKDWSQEPPVSNGPFYVLEQQPTRMILVKNEEYWDADTVALNKLILRFTEDGEEAAALWNSGEALWISGEVNLENLTDRSGILLNPMFGTHYYFIRSAQKPWNDHRVRRALSLALPWEQIRQGPSAAKTLIPRFFSGYPPIEGINTRDIETAQRLLAEAGYPQGTDLPTLVIKLTPSHEAARVGDLMAGAWMESLGIPVKIQVVPYGQYFQSLKQDDYEVGFTTWIGDFADPYTFLQMWRRDSNLNDARYNDADYEKLMDRSMSEEGGKRLETLAEAEKLLLDRGTVLPISYSGTLNIVDIDELEGWYPNILDIHPFKYLSYRVLKPLPWVSSLSNLVPPGFKSCAP